MTRRILVTEPLMGPRRPRSALLRERLEREFEGWSVDGVEQLTADYRWEEVEALACYAFPPVAVERLSGLRLLQSVSTGVEHLPLEGLRAHGTRICNAAGTSAAEIAEFVLGRILEDAKRFDEIRAAQHEHRWEHLYGESLRGAELVLVGFGALNQRVAELAAVLGMVVRVVRRAPGGDLPPGVVEQCGVDQLPRLAAAVRYLVSAVPQTPETTALIDAAVIDALPAGALLINVGRGNAVDGPALRRACAAGRIRAALDVFETEPLPPESPWWTAPGVRVSAHCSSVPDAALVQVEELLVQNLHRVLAGQAPLHQVAGPDSSSAAATSAP
ncbi:D-2-hydroxyacid dehydrogenase [Nocardioides sp.]|uniref:D-2-hydroxyacid dehydrogenase n=1 Tax=Nocardioides sp. TaxID=35761 RepID=UPI0026079A68|nr:D-2-hydroxyacid dehydrogenase [Nocardioides sp.]